MTRQMLLRGDGKEKIPILLVSGRSDLSEVAARVGTPYFLTKATSGYAKALLEMLDRALGERRVPTAA